MTYLMIVYPDMVNELWDQSLHEQYEEQHACSKAVFHVSRSSVSGCDRTFPRERKESFFTVKLRRND